MLIFQLLFILNHNCPKQQINPFLLNSVIVVFITLSPTNNCIQPSSGRIKPDA